MVAVGVPLMVLRTERRQTVVPGDRLPRDRFAAASTRAN